MTWEKLNVLVPEPDCDTDAGVITVWRDARPQPTQAAIDAVTQAQVDAQELVDFREKAKKAPDIVDSHLGVQARALIDLLNKRDNFLTNRIIELQDALAAMKATTGGVAVLRDAIPASFLATNTRPRADAIQDYKDNIDTGDADS
jgi:hypothetical protein